MTAIKFTEHAESQLHERKLTKLSVLATIRNPTIIKKQADGRFQFIKLFKQGNKSFLLISIVERMPSITTVVTVFKTSKIKKYL